MTNPADGFRLEDHFSLLILSYGEVRLHCGMCSPTVFNFGITAEIGMVVLRNLMAEHMASAHPEIKVKS